MQRKQKLLYYGIIPMLLVLFTGLMCLLLVPRHEAPHYPDAMPEPEAEREAEPEPEPEAEREAEPEPEPEAEPEPEPEEIPKFPWPPPRASATAEVPRRFFSSESGDVLRLGDVKGTLQAAFVSCGHFEMSYYSVPGGFAMATRLEQINRDGTSKEPPDRWAVEVQRLREFSLKAYLVALFTASPGYYRIIVFIVTSTPFYQARRMVSRQEAMDWLGSGLNELPDSIGELEYSEKYTCTALIYEFEQPNPGEPGELKIPSNLQGRTHLVKANLWQALED